MDCSFKTWTTFWTTTYRETKKISDGTPYKGRTGNVVQVARTTQEENIACSEMKCVAFMLNGSRSMWKAIVPDIDRKTHGQCCSMQSESNWYHFQTSKGKHMFSSMTERIHQSSSSSKLKYPKYTLLSPNLMFIEASYSTVDFCQLSKVQSSHLDLFTCWICFRSIIVVAGNARRQCQTFPWMQCVYMDTKK